MDKEIEQKRNQAIWVMVGVSLIILGIPMIILGILKEWELSIGGGIILLLGITSIITAHYKFKK